MKTLAIFITSFLLIACHNEPDRASFIGHKTINGTSLFVNAFGKGEPLLIIHGGPGLSHDYFLPHFKALSNDHFLIFYDQRGAGRSSIEIPSDSLNLETFVNDIEGIRKAFGIDKLNILSHSWGSLLSLEYALQYPNNIQKLVLSNPIPFSKEYDQLIREKQLSKMDKSWKNERRKIVGSSEYELKDISAYEKLFLLNFKLSFKEPAKVKDIHLGLNRNFIKGMELLQNFRGLEDFNYYTKLSRINTPVLLIRGSYDLTLSKIDKRAIDLLRKSELIEMKGSGHFPFIEEPDLYFEYINKFLIR